MKNRVLKENEEAIRNFEALWSDEEQVPTIQWEQLLNVPILTPYELAPGFVGYRLPNTNGDEIIFYCEISKGATLPKHDHDCWEKIVVVEGDLDNIDWYKRYAPYTLHTVTALEDTLIIVKFSRKYKK